MLTCACECSCFDQTRRNRLSRIREHATSGKSEVCKHLLQQTTHYIDFNTATILGTVEFGIIVHPRTYT